MTVGFIVYREGYKYILEDDFQVQLRHVRPKANVITPMIELTADGLLTIRRGYAWDGASGPTFDTTSSMRASLVHDALYQLIREGFLLFEQDRPLADRELEWIGREDGMWAARAGTWLRILGRFGGSSARPSAIKPLLRAP